MEPTLHCARPGIGCEAAQSDKLAVRSYGHDRPRRGDLVVFKTPPTAWVRCGTGGTFVKRLIGLPGERWSEQNGAIYIDGERLREPYIAPDRRDDQSFPGGRIPAGRYVVLGDNRASSCDSRIWGTVPAKNLVGRVVEIARGSKRIHIR